MPKGDEPVPDFSSSPPACEGCALSRACQLASSRVSLETAAPQRSSDTSPLPRHWDADLWKRSDHIKKWNKRWFVLWPEANRPGDGRVLFWFDKPVSLVRVVGSRQFFSRVVNRLRAVVDVHAGGQEGEGQRQANSRLV